jgi:hypothetical protein
MRPWHRLWQLQLLELHEGMLHVYDSICRNNFIVAGPDAGIELAWVDGVKIFNNTVWRQDLKGRGIRSIEKIHHVDIANNLVRGALLLAGGETARNNIVGPMDGWFVDPAAGNLRLSAEIAEVIDQGLVLAEIVDDIDARRRGTSPDIGGPNTLASERGERLASLRPLSLIAGRSGMDQQAILDRAERHLPASLGMMHLPVSANGHGPRLWQDHDFREYLDYMLGSGPLILGHCRPEVVEAVQRQAALGSTYFALNEPAIALAELIVESVPCGEAIRFQTTGSEATFAALRIARAFTG